jgi:hypothetical protein
MERQTTPPKRTLGKAPGAGPRVISAPPRDPDRIVSMPVRKLNALISQRIGEVKARYAPKAALADDLLRALAVEAAYVRNLEGQLRSLGHDPLRRPSQKSKDTTS